MERHNISGESCIEVIDDRDEAEPDYEINPILSSPDFQFSDPDPAVRGPEPRPSLEPAWNRVEDDAEENEA